MARPAAFALALAFAASCGTQSVTEPAATGVTESTLPTNIVPPSSEPPGSAPTVDTPVPSEPTSGSESSQGDAPACDLGAAISSVSHLVVARELSPAASIVTADGQVYDAVVASGYEVVARTANPVEDDGLNGMTPDFALQAVPVWADFVDLAALASLDDGESFVLFSRPTLLGRSEGGVALTALAIVDADGLVRLVGRCAEYWQPAIERGAAQLQRRHDIAFFGDLADWSSDAAAAVVAAFVDTDPNWHDLEAAERSLRLGDVPPEALPDFKLIGLSVTVSESFPQGFVSIASQYGNSLTFSTRNVTGVLPMLVPRADAELVVSFSEAPPDPSMAIEALGSWSSGSFDEADGNSLELSVVNGQPAADVAALADGELEVLMGISSDDIELLREQLLSTPYGG